MYKKIRLQVDLQYKKVEKQALINIFYTYIIHNYKENKISL